jgi:hypothetical protein
MLVGRGGVRILIDRGIDAARPRFVDEPQRIDALAPVRLPMTLWCVTCVGRPPFSPISIVSRTLVRMPDASSRMCEM